MGVGAGPVIETGDVEAFLRQAVEELEPERIGPRGRGAPRVLPAVALWTGMLVCVLRGMSSQTELWRLLASKGLWEYPRFPIGDEAVRKRLTSAGTAPLRWLFERISELLSPRLEPYKLRNLATFASDVVAIDQITLDKVARLLPPLRELDARHLLPGALAGVFDVRSQQWRSIQQIVDADQNEKVAAQGLLEGLLQGTLILFDLGYFGFAWFDELTDLHHHWVSRFRKGTSWELIHTYYKDGRTPEESKTFDGLVWLGKHRADRAKHAVRLVRFQQGGQERSYITNLLDPTVLPMVQIARLYARRWDFELAAKLVKRHLGLHLLWGCKQVVVQQQVWAVLIISQILQALRMEVAGRADVDVDEVSMELLVRYMPRFAARGLDPVKEFVEQGRTLGFIRPSRRITAVAPQIPAEQLHAAPPGLVLQRQPRYANRKCGPRSATPVI